MFGQAPLHLASKRVDWVNDSVKLMLHTSSYTPDQDAHDFENDLTNELTTAGGYTAGGATIANKTTTYDGASNTTKLDGDDVVWTSSTLTWRTAVGVDKTPGTTATNPLLFYQQGDVDTVSSGGSTTAVFAAAGIMTFVAA